MVQSALARGSDAMASSSLGRPQNRARSGACVAASRSAFLEIHGLKHSRGANMNFRWWGKLSVASNLRTQSELDVLTARAAMGLWGTDARP
jgi:hypothetical protein